MSRSIYILAVLLNCFLFCFAQQGNQKCDAETIINALKARGYKIESQKIVEKNSFKINPITIKFNNGLVAAKLIVLKLNEKSRVKFIVYDYGSLSLAQSQFNTICHAVKVDDDSFLSKDYDLILQDGATIYRLDAICLLAREEWNGIAKQVTDLCKLRIYIQAYCGGIMSVNKSH